MEITHVQRYPCWFQNQHQGEGTANVKMETQFDVGPLSMFQSIFVTGNGGGNVKTLFASCQIAKVFLHWQDTPTCVWPPQTVFV